MQDKLMKRNANRVLNIQNELIFLLTEPIRELAD
jgi:hypothetical protein